MFIKDNELRNIKKLIKGTETPDAILVGLKKLFLEHFDCEIFAYICDKVADGRLRLRFIVWDDATIEKFYKSSDNYYGCPDDKKINEIKSEFSKLCLINNLHKDYWESERYFAVPSEIRSDLLEEVQNRVQPQIADYLDKIKAVKKVAFGFGSVHIFYELDEDIESNSNNGVSDKIKTDIFHLKKVVDEFDVCNNSGVVFSSI
ncbi:MAG: hypothetical protein J6K92_10960, partial [Oscillospiraceae bacterium]|nr:hypothetical protein [Oscillospiraceae bacterium]